MENKKAFFIYLVSVMTMLVWLVPVPFVMTLDHVSASQNLLNEKPAKGIENQSTRAGIYSYWQTVQCNAIPVKSAENNVHYCRAGRENYTLAPGEALLLGLRPGASLRINRQDGAITINDLEVEVSNGSGIFHRRNFAQQKEKSTLIFIPESSQSGQVYRITRPGNFESEISIQVSGRIMKNVIPPFHVDKELVPGYRKVPVGGTISDIKEMGVIDALQQDIIEVSGPALIMLEHHPIYFDDDVQRKAEYRILAVLREKNSNSEHKRQIFEFTNLPDYNQLMTLGAVPYIFGRKYSTLLHIPQGDFSLDLTPTRPVVARLLREKNPDYLLSEINKPQERSEQIEAFDRLFSGPVPAWNLEKEFEIHDAGEDIQASSILQASRRLAIDNHHKPGGLNGARLLHKAMDYIPQLHNTLYLSPDRNAPNTFFRNLLPVDKADGGEQKSAWFVSPRLKNEADRNLVVGGQHVADLLSLLSRGVFVTIPDTRYAAGKDQGAKHAVQYNIPTRSTDSLLRLVALYPQEDTDLVLSMDNGTVHKLKLQTEPLFPDDEYRLSLPEFYLSQLNKRFQQNNTITLGGPFGLYQEPGTLVRVATVDISLPPEVRSVTLNQKKTDNQPVLIALQYRDAKFHTLAETDFLNALELVGGREDLSGLFRQWVDKKGSQGNTQLEHGLTRLALRDLENEYYPLIVYLRSLAYTFSHAVSRPPDPPDTASPESLNRGEVMTLAKQAEKNGQWLVALEQWAAILQNSTGKEKAVPALAHNRALKRLGEHYLAEVMLKGMYLHPQGSGGEALSRLAYEQLRGSYVSEQRDDKLLGLYAVEFSRTGDVELLLSMAELMAANDLPRFALLLALVHPDIEKSENFLLYNALRIGWRKLFERTLYQLENKHDYNYFDGLAKIFNGEIQVAEQQLKKGGDKGNKLLRARSEAKRITRMFGQADDREVIKKWQQWQSSYPAPFAWKQTDIIKDYAGTAMLLSKMRHVYGQYYRASPDAAVKILVNGPTELRFTIRPLHIPGEKIPLSSWIELSDGERTTFHPVNNNFPSQTVTLVNDKRFLAGQRELLNYKVAGGEHVLQLKSSDMPILIQVEQKLPVFACEILPWISRETERALLGKSVEASPVSSGGNSIACLFQECAKAVSLDGVSSETAKNIRKTILNIKTDSLEAETLPFAPKKQQSTGDGNSVQKMLDHKLPPNREQQLTHIARSMVFADDQKKQESLGQAYHLYHLSDKSPELSKLLQRQEFKSKWEPVEMIQAEEGLRYTRYHGWRPVSPLLRIRKTMLPAVADREEILHNQNRVVLAYDSEKSSRITVGLRFLEIPYLPEYPLTVTVTHKAGNHAAVLSDIELDSRNPEKKLSIDLEPGGNQLIFSLKKRYTNQFLAIRLLSDNRADPSVNSEPKERSYFVSSRENPVIASIDGPAMIRIDYLDGEDNVYSRYQYIENDWRELKIFPDQGKEIGLVRIYQLSPRGDREDNVILLRPPVPLLTSYPAAPSQMLLDDLADVSGFSETQGAPHGAFETGALYERRRDFEEDGQDDEKDDYFEAYLTHRMKLLDMPGYLRTTGLWRVPQSGGSVAGLNGELTWLPRPVPLTIRLAAKLYLQSPDNEDDFGWPGDEYSFLLRGTVSRKVDVSLKSYHLLSLSMFKRFLSLEDDLSYPLGHIDKDVFSTYKHDHQDGIRLGETFNHRPWLDTVWYVGGSITSNEWPEYLEPDNVRIRVGWKQMMKDLVADLSYRGVYYFNDEDRNEQSYKNAVQLDVSWDVYRQRTRRIRLGGMIRHDFDYNDFAYYFSLSCHFNETPDSASFKPGEIDFRDIKKLRRYQEITTQKEIPGE